MGSEETMYRKIDQITPSQLYLSSERLKDVNNIETEPLPIRRIGDELFFTDGHHRAFTLYKKGEKEVEVYTDEDDMDWLQYLICVNWCEKEGIYTIADMSDRIVSEKEFNELWIERCQSMHEQVDEDIFQFIEFCEEDDLDVKSEVCKNILNQLPEHFGIEQAVNDYIEGVRDKFFISVRIYDTPVGFTALKEHNKFTSEVYVIGILEEFQGRGIGKRLMEKVEQHLKSQGKRYLTVKTLGPSHPDEGYEKTRAFYRCVGFLPLEEFTTLWDENNPCLFMIKSLN